MRKSSNYFFTKGLLYLTVILTVLSQIDVIAHFTRPSMYASWTLLTASVLILKRGKIRCSRFLRVFFVNYFLYVLFCLITTSLGYDHLSSQYLRIMLVPFFITVLGNLFQDILDDTSICKMCKLYVISALIYAVYINATYFSSYQTWLNSNIYVFASKNSAAQIWFVAIFTILFIIVPNCVSKIRYLWFGIAFYFIVISSMSQCRSALLGMVFVVIYNVLIHSKHKVLWTIGIAGIAILLYSLPASSEFINQTLLLDKYANADLNTVSSGRLNYWSRALSVFNENSTNFLIGTGNYYVDCSYLSVLTESGLIGFLLIEPIWFYRIASNFKMKEISFARDTLFSSMTVFYIVISFLEGFPPFGPGVCSFMFWMLCAIGDNKSASMVRRPKDSGKYKKESQLSDGISDPLDYNAINNFTYNLTSSWGR